MNAPSTDVTTLGERALAFPSPAERAAFLTNSCGGDTALRERVETWLRENEARSPAATPAATPAAAPRQPEAGDRVGPFELIEPLGEGGGGIVWRAEQTEPVRREVALKILKAGMDSRQVLVRFEAERQALARMDHPNIAHIYDVGTAPSGQPFFAMELVRGPSLTDYCDAQALSLAERLSLFTQVCHAVQHAHQKGVIHRDLKPSNILVATPDAETTDRSPGRAAHGVRRPQPALSSSTRHSAGSSRRTPSAGAPLPAPLHQFAPGSPSPASARSALPKVIDFGIAKATEQPLTDKTLVTELYRFLGTPAYMSPEQLALGDGDVDTRADVYALGALLQQLLTGRTPFAEVIADCWDIFEIRDALRDREPARASAQFAALPADEAARLARQRDTDPARLAAELRADLDWIILKAIDRDRARRYASAAELAADLERVLRHEPISARPPSATYQLRKLVRRHRVAFTAGTAIAVALVAATVISLWQTRIAQREARKAREIASFMQQMLDGANPKTARGRDTTMLREILDQTSARIGTDLRGQPDVQAELRHVIGSTYFRLDENDRAVAEFEAEIRLWRSLPGHEAELANAYEYLGMSVRGATSVEDREARLERAEQAIREGLAIRRRIPNQRDHAVMWSVGRLGMILVDQGRLDEAEPLLNESLAARIRVLGEKHEDVASQYLNLANLAHARHDRAGVERLHAKALAIRRELFPDPHPDIVNSQLTYGKMLLDYGDSASAIEPLTEALLLCRQLFDPDHPPSKEALMLLQRALKDQGRLDELPQLIAAADAAPNAKGGWAAPHELLARLARDRGDFSLAIAHYSRALDSLRRQTNPPPDKLVATLAGISDVYQRQGRLGLALPFLREEHALNRTRLQARPHEFVQRAGAFSDALFQQKQTNEVVAVLGEMRSALARLPDASEVEWARLEGRESRALTLQGRLEEAERLARSAIARARSLGPEPAEILATSLDALTVVQRARGDAAGDLATRREAFAIREAMFGKDSPRMADPCFALGEALERAGQREEAARYFLQAWDFKQRDPAASRNFTPVALAQRLVELYEALQQPEQATVWKKKLAALTPPKSAAAPKP